MTSLLYSPNFGIVLSIGAYLIGLFIYKKTKLPIFNPLLITTIIIIAILEGFEIPIEAYNKGGDLIKYFLGPATVILAVPLYKQFDLLKKNFVPIIVGVFVGSATSMLSVILLSKLVGLNINITKSLVPKSITTPIGIEVSSTFGGIVPVTIVAIVITGILGAILGPTIVSIGRIKSKVAKGIAIGTATHAIGTSKALELGEVEGAMSGLAIGLAGSVTVLLAPIIYAIFF